jgi:hypothetical protein
MPVTLKFDVSGSFMGFKLEFNYAAINNEYDVTVNKIFANKIDSTTELLTRSTMKQDNDEEALRHIHIDQDLRKKEMRKQIKEYEKQARQKKQEDQNVVIDEYVDIDSLAYKKDSVYWAEIRPIPLTTLELKNYEAKDSLIIERKKEEAKDSIKAEKNKKFRIEHLIVGNN